MIRLTLIAVMLITMAIPTFAADQRGVSVRPKAPTGDTAKGDLWFLGIGINSYLSWPQLKTAVNDARAVKDVLLKRYHLNPDHVVELTDDKATRHNILAAFRDLAKRVKPEDSLLVYYAGHGHIDPITGKGSWIPVESGTDDPTAWIDNRNITDYLNVNAIKARHILMVSDSCFSGDFFRGNRGALPTVDDAFLKKAYTRSSRQAISSGGLEPVSDAGFGGNSVFSHFLVASLESNSKPYLIPSEIFGEIKAGVGRNADQLPQFGDLHGVGGQDGGELILFLKSDSDSRMQDMGVTSAARQKELAQLKKAEAEAASAKQKEQAEIAKQQTELDKLDKQIAEMKGRLGTGAVRSGDSLDNIIALADQKEAQGNRLEELRKQREEEEQKRQQEIVRLKKEAAAKRVSQIKTDLAKYEKVAASKYAQDMKGSAWDALLVTYPEAKWSPVGNADAFLSALGLAREGSELISLERWQKGAARPVLPFTVNEDVWKTIENSEAYRNLPRPRVIKVSYQTVDQMEYTGSVSKTLPPPAPVEMTVHSEVTPLNNRCSLQSSSHSIQAINNITNGYGCGYGYISLGSTLNGKTTSIVESIDKLEGSLFPMRIGAQLSVSVKAVVFLADKKIYSERSYDSRVEERGEAKKLNPKFTGMAWKIQNQGSNKTLDKTYSSASVDYYLEDLGVFMSSIGQVSVNMSVTPPDVKLILPEPGVPSTLYDIAGEYGSRTTHVYRSYDWTVGK